ncbi:MAG: hypothetical protein K2N99_01260, partial [Malacoplasma sp.]|nr:hypothetical protein [Malacoplasma sp.]
MNYSATYIEKYSVGIYTEENCNDILNSKGYSSLTKVSNLELKQRIVRNLSDLISNKGNNYILEIIMNKILMNPNSELKRYYLEKQYDVDNTSAISIDTSKGLEKSVDLIFREVPALSINELSSTVDKYHEYDSFVNGDNLWGGLETSDTSQTRETKKMVLKRKLMGLPFNSILTKYITLTQSVDILESQRELRDAVYLMLKYFDEHEYTPFFKEKILFGSISVTPSALFAGMCWLQQMKYYSDPDKIIYDNCVINSSVVFRNMGTTSVDVNNLENKTFIIDGKPVVIYNISPEIASWKVVDFIKENIDEFKDFMTDIGVDGERIETCRITDQYNENGTIREKGIVKYEILRADGNKYLNDSMETIEDDLVRFRFFSEGRDLGDFTSSTTFEELITDYKNQYPNLIERINKKLKESYDYREYQAWSYLLKLNRTDNSIDFIFKGFDTFSSYMDYTESSGLVEYILNTIPKMDDGKYNIETIVNVQNQLSSAFKTWVNDTFSTLVYQASTGEDSGSGSGSDTDGSFVNDMKLLFDEFLSVFTQLYSV